MDDFTTLRIYLNFWSQILELQMICKSSKCQLLQSANYSLSQFEQRFPEKNSARRVAFQRVTKLRGSSRSTASACRSGPAIVRPNATIQPRKSVA